MVLIDQLRISDDGQFMYINARVPEMTAFENLYITSLVIKTASQVSETAPETVEGNFIYKETFEVGEEAYLERNLSINDMVLYDKNNFSEDLFFVYITTEYATDEGQISPNIPCRMDEMTSVGVTFDENLLYQKVMGFTKQLHTGCNTPNKEFIDFILLWNAFKASVETEHFISAKMFYKYLFDDTTSVDITKNCGCHG